MRNGGKISLLGISNTPVPMDMNKIITKGLTLQGIYGRKHVLAHQVPHQRGMGRVAESVKEGHHILRQALVNNNDAVNVKCEDLPSVMHKQGLVEGFDIGLEMSGNGAGTVCNGTGG